MNTHIRQKENRLVVFIDDLDRCMPEKAIEVLEAIKLFLDVQGCIFVLGLDQEVIARGIELKYRELGLEKRANYQTLSNRWQPLPGKDHPTALPDPAHRTGRYGRVCRWTGGGLAR